MSENIPAFGALVITKSGKFSYSKKSFKSSRAYYNTAINLDNSVANPVITN